MQHASNYDKFPAIRMDEGLWSDCTIGWDAILGRIERQIGTQGRRVLVVECYPGVEIEELTHRLRTLNPELLVDSSQAMLPPAQIDERLKEDVTDDELFGFMTRYDIDIYFDPDRTKAIRSTICKASGLVIVYGTGAAYLAPAHDLLVYADMARWEIQRRMRAGQIGNIGADNRGERASLKYKRAFFVDWRICDRFKRQLFPKMDLILDTNQPQIPKMIAAATMFSGLEKAASEPFRVVPFFDPGPWGGQWMKEICGLNPEPANYAWCFDCVPEENSLLLRFGETDIEIPSLNLVFCQPRRLLGDAVHARFGEEFPIRFDFLDTMQGGNLSLQVHPLTTYIQQKFGMHYTQDESYYLLDAAEGACVYLGLKNGTVPTDLITALEEAQQSGQFDAERYVGKYPVRKHQHVLIPAGTIHCSGAESMVLEISATPYIFTFKLWDWGRLGLDGRPRPINIGHGKHVIQWDRDEEWIRANILDRVTPVSEGDGWREERTGLHEREFIETRRHWFHKPVIHHTNGGVNVLNLVEGREVTVDSPSGRFAPFVVHYAETFIVPAAVGAYRITPSGESCGQECATIKAYVRTNP